MNQYLYVVSENGDPDASPAKIGITTVPNNRIHGICSNGCVDNVKYAAAYETDVAARAVERGYKDQSENERVGQGEEWLGVSAHTLIKSLESDDRCTPLEEIPDRE
jgi:hypothetical protein